MGVCKCHTDFVSLSEAWVEEKDMKFLEQKLPNNFAWEIIPGKRVHKKGRTSGGFIIGINKKWKVEIVKIAQSVLEGLIKTQLSYDNKTITIWSVFNSGGTDVIWEHLEEWGFLEEGIMMIGGDFNIRNGNEGNARDYCSVDKIRESKDKVISNGERKRIEFISSKAWIILNGYIEGDEEGEFKYVSNRGCSTIDYAIVNEDTLELIEEFRVEESIDSNYLPLKIKIRLNKENKENDEEQWIKPALNKPKVKMVYSWSEKDKAIFEKETRELVIGKEGDTGEERWREIKQIVAERARKKDRKIKEWKIGMRKWWDSSCARKKEKGKEGI